MMSSSPDSKSFATTEAIKDDHEDLLTLSLCSSVSRSSSTPMPSMQLTLPAAALAQSYQSTPLLPQYFSITPPPPSHHHFTDLVDQNPNQNPNPNPNIYRSPSRSSSSRTRKSPVQMRQGKTEIIPVPYQWAKNRRAMIHSIDYLSSKNISMISGEVQCKNCEEKYEIEFNLREKFIEVSSFIKKNKCTMHCRAPGVWMNPVLPDCKICGQNNSVKPLIVKKKSINWLFLFLGQMLGCCRLDQLKYFCKHTKNHRTGAKDRVLYLTYLCLCKQLDPKGPYDI